jgi:hypothetical protein
MAMPEPQESAENNYFGHCMLFTLENQHSHRRKAYQNYMNKITMKQMPCLREVGPLNICLAP